MTKGLFPIVVVLFLAAAGVASGAEGPDRSPSVLVRLTRLEKGSLPQVVEAFGRAEPTPAARQAIQAPVAAVVDAVYVKSGQEVAKGAPLIRLGPSPATAESFEKAKSALRAAQEDERRTASLAVQHLATGQQLAQARKAVADAQASLSALQAVGADSARTLNAPFAAVVTQVAASPGALVGQGGPLLDLAMPSDLTLRVGLTPAQAATVKKGDPATITPLGAMSHFSGRVLARGAMIDPQTGLVSIEIEPQSGALLPGQTAQAAITVAQVEGYVVPHEALLIDERGAPYLVQAKDGAAHIVPVRVLLAAGDKDVVAGALDPMAYLVLSGNYQLKEGMRVRADGPQPVIRP